MDLNICLKSISSCGRSEDGDKKEEAKQAEEKTKKRGQEGEEIIWANERNSWWGGRDLGCDQVQRQSLPNPKLSANCTENPQLFFNPIFMIIGFSGWHNYLLRFHQHLAKLHHLYFKMFCLQNRIYGLFSFNSQQLVSC